MIDLSNNKLIRFEEAAFLPLLEQITENKGKLRLDRSIFDIFDLKPSKKDSFFFLKIP